jgi:hypothetical protein
MDLDKPKEEEKCEIVDIWEILGRRWSAHFEEFNYSWDCPIQ